MTITYNNGLTSSTMPGKNGSIGERAPFTFFSSINTAQESTADIGWFDINIDGKMVRIIRSRAMDRKIGDYIVYSDISKTYLARITELPSETEIIDIWESPKDNISKSLNDIDIEVVYTSKEYTINELLETNFIAPSDKLFSTNGGMASPISNTHKNNDIKIFTIITKNTNPIGEYKIELEFTTDLVSPNMDSILTDKFIRNETINLFAGIKFIDNGIVQIDNQTYNEPKFTLRGAIENYNRKKKGSSIDFDGEYLERFSLIIKDFLDGVGMMSYSTNIQIPLAPLKRVLTTKKQNTTYYYDYKCFIYIYTKNNDNTYTKSIIGEIPIDELISK